MMKLVESLYIHFPFCRHLCNYCDFHKSIISSEKLDDFESLFIQQFEKNNEYLKRNGFQFGDLKTIYIGGGTPSLWGARGIKLINKLLKTQKIKLSNEFEWTSELNPGSWKKDDLLEMLDLGVNRFSVGVQSMNPETLKLLDRVHSIDDVHQTLSLVNKLGVNFSVDLMMGLPKRQRNERDLIGETKQLLEYDPNHLSSYILTVNKNYLHYSSLPEEEQTSSEFMQLSEFLTANKFNHYEVSNFALSGFESEHNLQYWKQNSVAALGPSGTGFLRESKTSALRYKWKTNGKAELTEEALGKKELSLEDLYLSLRTSAPVDLSNYLNFNDEVDEIINDWTKYQVVRRVESSTIQVLPKGFLLLDSLIGDLFKFI